MESYRWRAPHVANDCFSSPSALSVDNVVDAFQPTDIYSPRRHAATLLPKKLTSTTRTTSSSSTLISAGNPLPEDWLRASMCWPYGF